MGMDKEDNKLQDHLLHLSGPRTKELRIPYKRNRDKPQLHTHDNAIHKTNIIILNAK